MMSAEAYLLQIQLSDFDHLREESALMVQRKLQSALKALHVLPISEIKINVFISIGKG